MFEFIKFAVLLAIVVGVGGLVLNIAFGLLAATVAGSVHIVDGLRRRRDLLRWPAVGILAIVGLAYAVELPIRIKRELGEPPYVIGLFFLLLRLTIIGLCWTGIRRLTRNRPIPGQAVGMGLIVVGSLFSSACAITGETWTAWTSLAVAVYGLVVAVPNSPGWRFSRPARPELSRHVTDEPVVRRPIVHEPVAHEVVGGEEVEKWRKSVGL